MTQSPSQAIIDLDAYAHNLGVLRGMTPKECAILGVVKADAYGLGAVPIARRALREGIGMLGVATTDEAAELRNAGITAPIFVMMQPLEAALPAIVEHNLRVAVGDLACAEHLGELARRANKVVPIHCKIDTGMGRQGFLVDDAIKALLHITRISHVDIEGILTHFAVADEPNDLFTTQQIRAFRQLLNQLDKEGVPYEMAHAANSAALINFPSSTFDMVRPGLAAFGVWPTDPAPEITPLRPVLRWESRLSQVKALPQGHSIGYGRLFIAPGPMKAAVVPVGYADGYRHNLVNRAHVLVRGMRCPVRGNISMDQIVVDVTNVPGAVTGDKVTLIGREGDQQITVDEMARWAETIPYEIMTGLGKRVERVYVGTAS